MALVAALTENRLRVGLDPVLSPAAVCLRIHVVLEAVQMSSAPINHGLAEALCIPLAAPLSQWAVCCGVVDVGAEPEVCP